MREYIFLKYYLFFGGWIIRIGQCVFHYIYQSFIILYNQNSMSQIYKAKNQTSDQEEEEQKNYVQVSDKKKKKQILQKQQAGSQVICQIDGSIVFKQPPKIQQKLIVVEPTESNIQEKIIKLHQVQKESNQNKDKKPDLQQAKKRRVVKDDREKIKVKQVDRQQQKIQDNNNQRKNQAKKDYSKKKYQQPKQIVNYDAEDEDFNSGKKVRYIAKQQQHPVKKYVEKNVNKIRRQQQVKNGQKITVEVIQNNKQYVNQIYINRKEVNDYVQLALKLLDQYDFIVLKAFGYYVTKAFQVAGILQQQISSLHQISVPSIIRVKQITKIGSKELNRAFISIQLSLNYLNPNHIGYQQSASKKKPKYQQKQTTKKYQQKYVQKQSENKEGSYKNEKGSYRNDKSGQNYQNKYKQRVVDERQLR